MKTTKNLGQIENARKKYGKRPQKQERATKYTLTSAADTLLDLTPESNAVL